MRLLLCCYLLFFGVTMHAQVGRTLFDELTHEAIIPVVLSLPMDSFAYDADEPEYYPASFSFTDRNGQSVDLQLKVRVRGRFRLRTCDYPPLKLNFKKGDLEDMGLERHDEFKLVTPCIKDRTGEDYLLREFLTYQIYRILTPVHFRTQLMEVVFQDKNSKRKRKSYAFLLEDEETLAERYESEICDDCFGNTEDSLVAEQARIFCLFQYMIGNTDWSFPMARNLELLVPEAGGKKIPVPYDFDFCGVVNASYASADSNYGLENKRDRIFIGHPSMDKELLATKALFREKKSEIYNLIENFAPLPKRSRKDIIGYLDEFYEALDSGIRFSQQR